MSTRRAIGVVAWIFLAWGASGAAEMGVGILDGRVVVSVNALGLWVGPGLFRRNARSYRWARNLVRLQILLLVPATMFLFVRPLGDPVRVSAFGRSLRELPGSMVPIVVAVLGALAAWQMSLLRRPDVREAFESASPSTAG